MTLFCVEGSKFESDNLNANESRIDIDFDAGRRNGRSHSTVNRQHSTTNMAENLMHHSSKDFLTNLNVSGKMSQVFTFGEDPNPELKIQASRLPKLTILHYSGFKAAWDW